MISTCCDGLRGREEGLAPCEKTSIWLGVTIKLPLLNFSENLDRKSETLLITVSLGQGCGSGSGLNRVSFSAVNFFKLLVIKNPGYGLDPDLIRIGIQPKMLHPDPNQIDADSQPCFRYFPGTL
jgi:hypothetical protein